MNRLSLSMKLTVAATALFGGLAALPEEAAACATSDSQYIASICYTAAQYCPDGYLPASGQLLQINAYQALYSLLGVTYGGDARTTFGVPNLNGRSVIGPGQTLGGSLNAHIGQYVGTETVTLAPNQMAAHSHPAVFTPTGGGSGGGAATASGTINVPVTGTVSGITVNSTPNLTATTSGTVKLANTAGNGSNAPSPGNVLTSAGVGAKVYGAATTGDFDLGGTQTFTGAVSGSVTSTATGGTVSGTASGPVSLNVTGGSGGITGGTVTIGSNIIPPATTQPVPIRDPSIVLTACIAETGIYPPRP